MPLDDVLVLDLTRVVAGPYCTQILGDFGARVIKIENPADPDYTRDFPPLVEEGGKRASGYFAQYNRNKEAVTLNLKHPEGVALFKRMVRQADIVVENFRPGVMARFGAAYEDLAAENPRLIYAAISGFGQFGPYSQRPGFDNTGQALGGLWSVTGYPDRPPVRVGTIIGDLAASLYASIGIMMALRARDLTGFGQQVDVSQQDSVFSLLEGTLASYQLEGKIQRPNGNKHPFLWLYDLYPCKDGYFFWGGYTDRFFRFTCEAFGEAEFAHDPEIDTVEKRMDYALYERKIEPKLREWFGRYTKQELEDMLADHVPAAPVKDVSELIDDPQLAARQMIEYLDLPGGKAAVPGVVPKLSATPGAVQAAPPALGQDSAPVFAELLGLDGKAVERLRAEGVI